MSFLKPTVWRVYVRKHKKGEGKNVDVAERDGSFVSWVLLYLDLKKIVGYLGELFS